MLIFCAHEKSVVVVFKIKIFIFLKLLTSFFYHFLFYYYLQLDYIYCQYRYLFRNKRRLSIAPLPALRINDKELMANEFDTHSMISNQASITSASSLASLLREKMQVSKWIYHNKSKHFCVTWVRLINKLEKVYELCADLCIGYVHEWMFIIYWDARQMLTFNE